MVGWCLHLYLILLAAICVPVSAQNALIDAEKQVLLDNNFTITVHEQNRTITIEHHGLPDHPFDGGWGNNPNTPSKVNHRYNLPLQSTNAITKGCAGRLGVIGLAISGAAFYNPYTGNGHNAVEGDCAETLDDCKGHPSPDGTYHYHAIPKCLYKGDLKDKFLGVALDGYPIYGPMDSSGKNLTSADLDICHGHYYNNRYMYRVTFDFPYIISCFHGVSSQTQTGSQEGSGMQRPRPPRGGRKRRQAVHSIQKRQTTDQTCRQTVNANWVQETCHVVCENANRDLDTCPTRSGATTTGVPDTTSVKTVTVTSQQTTHLSKETSMATSSPTIAYALTAEEVRALQESDLTLIINENNQTITIRHSGVPDHEFEGGWGQNPNTPEEQYHSFNIPMMATVAEDKGCVRLGSIGISLSGAPFYNPYTNTGYNAVQGNCKETFDDCSGHPAGNGAYHYHKLPACLYKGSDLRNKLLGVALDGYPIYGPMDMSGKNWTSRELDKCHGHVDPYDNRYKYRITMDFPYILGCYHGNVINRARSGRDRRDVENDLHVYRYKRQLPSSRQCNLEEEINWKQETCFAFCETPSKNLDDCEPVSEVSYNTTERDVNTMMTTTETDISGSSGHVISFCAIIQVAFICRSIYRRIS